MSITVCFKTDAHKPTSELTVTMPIFYVQCTGLPSLNQQSWAHGKREE